MMGKRKYDIEQQLREAILESGISRYRLAQLSGVAEAVLSTFVRGKRSINITSATKLAKILKLRLTKDEMKGR